MKLGDHSKFHITSTFGAIYKCDHCNFEAFSELICLKHEYVIHIKPRWLDKYKKLTLYNFWIEEEYRTPQH